MGARVPSVVPANRMAPRLPQRSGTAAASIAPEDARLPGR